MSNVVILKTDIERMYFDSGLSFRKISNKYDMDEEKMRGTFERYGIELKKEDKKKKNRDGGLKEDEDLDENDNKKKYRDKDWLVENFVEGNKSKKDLAEECGCCVSTIRNWLSRFGLVEKEKEYRKYCRFNFGTYKLTEGYPTWSATGKNADKGHLRVHRLVAIADGEDPEKVFSEDYQVHHRNGFKIDNRPENLELVDPRTHGKYHSPKSVRWADDDIEYVMKAMLDPQNFIE